MDQAEGTRRQFFGAAALLPAAAKAAAGLPAAGRLDLGLAPGLIHFNTASAGPTPRPVLDATVNAWRLLETDPVVQAYGKDPATAASLADATRGKAARLVGCSADEILLTSGTTNGITTLANSIKLERGDRLVLTDKEHEGGETGWLNRARRDGIVVDRVAIPFGDFDSAGIVRRFEAAIGPRTRAVCFSQVLSPNGLRMPAAEIAALARSRGVLSIVDGAQAVGGIDVDVRALGCDAYATSGHKWLMGPKGTGFVYVRQEATAIDPPQWLFDKRFVSNSAGLTPIALSIGFGAAIDQMLAWGAPAVERRVIELRNRFYAALQAFQQLQVVSPPPGALATALVAVMLPPQIDSQLMRERLHDRHGIIVKMAEKRWFNGLRFSPHVFNDEAQVDRALAALREELSTFPPG